MISAEIRPANSTSWPMIRCGKCGHETGLTLLFRTGQRGCPVCKRSYAKNRWTWIRASTVFLLLVPDQQFSVSVHTDAEAGRIAETVAALLRGDVL